MDWQKLLVPIHREPAGSLQNFTFYVKHVLPKVSIHREPVGSLQGRRLLTLKSRVRAQNLSSES